MKNKNIFDSIKTKEPIDKGYSEDKKYCMTVVNGTKYLLRISPLSLYKSRKSLFALHEELAALNVPMCVPVEFGTCNDGVYYIQSWIDGEDLETALPRLSDTEQYTLGVKAGEILRKIHSIPLSESHIDYWTAVPVKEDWAIKYNRQLDKSVKDYQAGELRFIGDNYVLDYIENNRHLLSNRPQCFDFDDYNVFNMMFSNGDLIIIDFERYNIGDPWEAFSDIVWSVKHSHHFSTGQIRGYFGGEPPEEFWELLALYFSDYLLSFWKSQPITIEFWRDITSELSQNILKWFDNMQNPVPTWYLKNFHVQWIDGKPYKLLEPYDFSFINKYGKVFTVFDEQGVNVCFGVQDGDKKYFVKFAGAKPIHFEACKGNTVLAVEWLKNAVSVYRDLEHHTLIKFISAEEIGGGYAAVFEWVDAIGIEPLNSPDYMRFMQMSVDKKMQAFEDIVAFHVHAAAKGYVAIDFYDGSILYDYGNEKVIICDIDFYQKSPYIGEMGLWGSSRFVSPEECTPGAVMDEITMVYTMGATAFSLFAYGDRSPEAWTLNTVLYDVAKRAVSDERGQRQQSIQQFIKEWRTAK